MLTLKSAEAQGEKETLKQTAEQGFCIAQPTKICLIPATSLLRGWSDLSSICSESLYKRGEENQIQKIQAANAQSTHRSQPAEQTPPGVILVIHLDSSLSLSLRAPCLASQKNKINSRYWLAQAYQNIYKCIWQFTYVSPHGELSQSCCQHCCLALPRFPGTALPSPPLPGDAKESPGSSRAALCCVMPEEFIPAFFPGEGIVKILLGSLSAEHFLKLFPDISPETQIPLSFHC